MNQARRIVIEDAPPPAERRPGVASWYTPGFSDGLGDRLLMFDNTAAASLELLRFKPEFGNNPDFERALRHRLKQFERFSHPSVARVRSVDWLDAEEGLALVSNHVAGRRLSEMLDEAQGPAFAMELLRQLMPVLATLQQYGQGIAHGVLTPERIVVTPRGRLVIVEHVLGRAIESLHLPASRLQSELGIAVPAGRDYVAADARTDVVQLALVALSLLVGRPVEATDYPEKSADLLDEFSWSTPLSSSTSPRLRWWLECALQLEGRTFATAQDAHEAFSDLQEEHELHMAGQPRFFQTISAAAEAAMPPKIALAPSLSGDAPPVLRPVEVEPVNAEGQTVPFERKPIWLTDANNRVEAAPVVETPVVAVVEELPQADRAMAMPVPRRRVTAVQWAMAALAVAVLTQGGVIGWLMLKARAAAPTAAPKPQVTTATAGGPASVTTGAGTATVATLNTSAPAAIGGGLAAAALPVGAAAGNLEVLSDPPGAKVTVDGVAQGLTPAVVLVGAGPHTVIVSNGRTTTTQTMNAVAGSTSTLMATLAPAGAAAGWVSIAVPFELQVREGGTLLGITSADRLMLPAGRHELEIVNTALGVQRMITVDIEPGRTTKATVAVPNGSLSINALPWANVWLDGQPLVGTTPIANLSVPLGSHELLYKHPQFGDRRQTVVVTAKAPVRIVMDLTK